VRRRDFTARTKVSCKFLKKPEDFVPIIVNLDVMLAKRKMRSKDLAMRIGITEQNVSLLKSGKVRGVRFETLEKICEVLDCQPADILEYRREGADDLVPIPSARRRKA
jgi:putative transcriptional regulator